MNFSPTSDSSDDSPAHNVSIRLSDIGKIDMYGNAQSSRFEIDAQTLENKEQLHAALRKIDGTPSYLEKAIDLEQRKSIFGKSSLHVSGSKTKRVPPRPPVGKVSEESAHQQIRTVIENRAPAPPRPQIARVPIRRALEFHPVDYSTITSPDSIEKTR